MRAREYLTRISLTLCLVTVCLFPQALFAHKDIEPKDQEEALKWAGEALSSFANVKVNDQYLLYGEKQVEMGIALARISKISFVDTGKYPYRYAVYWTDYAHDAQEQIFFGIRRHKDAEHFAAALEYLSSGARQSAKTQFASQWAKFEALAGPWREAATKPAMPESAREHQVLAEYAFKEKNTEKAIQEYSAALDIFPTWPEGQFNLATLAGEKKYYELAVLHMKEYLELVPDSSDAQAAKDSIIIWRDKLSGFLAQDESVPVPQSGKATLKNTSAPSK